MNQHTLPRLVTFDGEARSGKGTVVQATKDYLRDQCGYKVMLIDAGQVFRVLVVAAVRAGVDVDNPGAIDEFLQQESNVQAAARLVKEVYHMDKDERDALLYTNEVGANSSKFGARALSQNFKDELLKKWLRDARTEGYEVVLLDGRALDEVGTMLEAEGLCEFVFGLYFVCDPVVGARRTLGYAATAYDDLSDAQRTEVDQLVVQINGRNQKDRDRIVHPIIPPAGAPTWKLPADQPALGAVTRPMITIDTSAEISKSQMSQPVAQCVASVIL